jgi:hypothetical protein
VCDEGGVNLSKLPLVKIADAPLVLITELKVLTIDEPALLIGLEDTVLLVMNLPELKWTVRLTIFHIAPASSLSQHLPKMLWHSLGHFQRSVRTGK